MRTKACGAALAVGALFAVPALAQNNDQQPVDVTAAPPPSADTVGPSQLRDFNLGGRPTRPAPSTAAPSTLPPAQQPTQPLTGPSTTSDQPAPAAEPRPSGGDRPTAVRTVEPAAINPAPSSSAPTPSPSSSEPVPGASEPAAESPAPAVIEEPAASPLDGVSLWPWLGALLAAVLAAGLLFLFRQQRSAKQADPGRLAFAGAVADPEPVPPTPRVPVQPDPKPVSASGNVVSRVAGPMPAPAPAPAPTPAPISDGLITSSALRPSLDISFHPERLVVTDQEVVIQFDVRVANVGGAPARNVLVEAVMVTASATQDEQIASFFHNPNGKGDRVPGIERLDALTLKSLVRMPLDIVSKFEAGGRTLFVPLVAFNVLYGTGANERQVSASFLVGRGKPDAEKLAPFRLDLGPRIFRDVAARAHSAGLTA